MPAFLPMAIGEGEVTGRGRCCLINSQLRLLSVNLIFTNDIVTLVIQKLILDEQGHMLTLTTPQVNNYEGKLPACRNTQVRRC